MDFRTVSDWHPRSSRYPQKPLTRSEVTFQRLGPGQGCVGSTLSEQPQSGAATEGKRKVARSPAGGDSVGDESS